VYKEERIRQILHEFKMQTEYYKQLTSQELKQLHWHNWVILNEKIILLETILEESKWQKLINQHKKENVFIRRFDILCDYLFRSLRWK